MKSDETKKVALGRAIALREAETAEKAKPTQTDIKLARQRARKVGGLVKALVDAKPLAG